ncbi:MAG: FdtA/QdtA family cupin domain-containing protein [Saprospiraceae bacterium]|nr:FdtA/QdtA family cupin domain-containing protein [Saprospiraceae bacterium]
MKNPYLINFDSIGSRQLGFISVAESLKNIPFSIKRVYWTYYTPHDVIRGGHANIEKEMILIAIAGNISVEIETKHGVKSNHLLNTPSNGLYIPPLSWHNMKYSHNAVQLVFASNIYSESDYIRDYEEFKRKYINQ